MPSKMPGIPNSPAEGVPYFTPAQVPPSGTASDPQPTGKATPKVFTPLTLRGVTFQNRIWLSPLCQYSAEDGHHTAWHMAHLGGIISRGPGLSIVEATSVTAEGRITPQDSGIWKDSQIEGLKNIVDFAHSQGQKIGIQIAHAGRKASTNAPWLTGPSLATEDVGGWPNNVLAPSAIPWGNDYPNPKQLSLKQIDELKVAWVAAVKRCVKAGFDVIEIHNAHGYLLQSFLSPVSNTRTDKYGGSFENRIRLTLEIVELTRAAIPDSMPLLLRISATDLLETNPEWKGESWTVADSAKLAPLLAARGVDLLDVSSGGNHPMQKIKPGPGYQVSFAKTIKAALGPNSSMKIGTVGSITGGQQAEEILTGKGDASHGSEELDVAFVGRMFQKNPAIVWSWAEELGVEINIANQIRWAFGGRPGAPKK